MVFEFSDVRVDTRARTVWRASEPLHLTRKAFDLLAYLLEERPNVLANEQIHGRLWPTTFVSESSVQALISEIRHAIGDDGQKQALLRTVRGVGYAFHGPVTEIREAPPSPSAVRAWLVAEGLKVPLRAGENVLGRGGDDVIEIDGGSISRRHARVVIADGAWVEDLGSKNGTWVRDARVTGRAPLVEGDPLRLGSMVFTFRYSRGAESTDTVSQQTAS